MHRMSAANNRLVWSVLALAIAAIAQPSTRAAQAREFDPQSYRSIVVRNPFGLKPPPEPVKPAPPPEPPKAEIKLTGITSLLSPPRAYIMTKEPDGTTEFYSLSAGGGSEDGLEVLEIDTDKRSVRIRNGGQETLLTFATHGLPASGSGGGGGPTAAAKAAAAAQQRNAAAANAQKLSPIQRANLRQGNSSISSRNTRDAVSTPSRVTATPSSPRVRTIPQIPRRDVRTSYGGGGGNSYNYGSPGGSNPGNQNNSPGNQQPQQPRLSAEEQQMLMEAQRMTSDQVLPPTPGLPSTTSGSGQQGGSGPPAFPPSPGFPAFPGQ